MAIYVPTIDAAGWQMRYAGSGKLQSPYMLPHLEIAQSNGVRGHKHRIGNGKTLDESFKPVYQNCKDIGMPLGCYWYLQPKDSTPQQVHDRLAAWLAPYPLVKFIALDCENFNGQPLNPTASDRAWLGNWLYELLVRLADVRDVLVIYAGDSWWNPQVGYSGGRFLNYPVIGPRYARQSSSIPQEQWSKPPVDATQWENWVPWSRPPQPALGLQTWGVWQFSSWGDAIPQGWPQDAAVRTLDLNLAKLDVFNLLWGNSTPEPEPEPIPVPVPTPGETFMTTTTLTVLGRPERPYDSRSPDNPGLANPLHAGEIRAINIGHSEANVAQIHVTVDQPQSAGFLTFWDGSTPVPAVASVNFAPGQVAQTLVTAPVVNGQVYVYSTSVCHVIFDLQAVGV